MITSGAGAVEGSGQETVGVVPTSLASKSPADIASVAAAATARNKLFLVVRMVISFPFAKIR
jgi:hypothetical protein